MVAIPHGVILDVMRECVTENFLLSSGACLFNKADPTYYNTACIDLAIGHSHFYLTYIGKLLIIRMEGTIF